MYEQEVNDCCEYILSHNGTTAKNSFCCICEDILNVDHESRLESLEEMTHNNKYFINATHCIDTDLLIIRRRTTRSQMIRYGNALVDLIDAFISMNRRNLRISTRERIIREALTIFFQTNYDIRNTGMHQYALADDTNANVVNYQSSVTQASPPRWSWFGKTSDYKVSLYKKCISLVALDLAARASMAMYGINFYTHTSNENKMHTSALLALLGGNALNRLIRMSSGQRLESDEPKGVLMFIMLELFKSLSIIWLQYVANAPGWSNVRMLHNYNMEDTVLMSNVHAEKNLDFLKYAGTIDHVFIAIRQLLPFIVSLFFLDGKDKWTRFVYSVSFANHALSNIPGAKYGKTFNLQSERFKSEKAYSGYVEKLSGHIKDNWEVKTATAKFYGIGSFQEVQNYALSFLMLADTHLEPWKDPILGTDAFAWAMDLGFVKHTFSKRDGKQMEISDDMKWLLPRINSYLLRVPFAKFSFESIVQRVAENLESDSICEYILGRDGAYSQIEIQRFKKTMNAIRPTVESFLASFYDRYYDYESYSSRESTRVNLEEWRKKYGTKDASTTELIQEIDNIFYVYLQNTLHIKDLRFARKNFFVDYSAKK